MPFDGVMLKSSDWHFLDGGLGGCMIASGHCVHSMCSEVCVKEIRLVVSVGLIGSLESLRMFNPRTIHQTVFPCLS